MRRACEVRSVHRGQHRYTHRKTGPDLPGALRRNRLRYPRSRPRRSRSTAPRSLDPRSAHSSSSSWTPRPCRCFRQATCTPPRTSSFPVRTVAIHVKAGGGRKPLRYRVEVDGLVALYEAGLRAECRDFFSGATASPNGFRSTAWSPSRRAGHERVREVYLAVR